MKKAIAIVAVLAVLVTAAAFLTGAVSLPGEPVTALTLTADPSTTNEMRSSAPDVLAAFEALRAAGQKASTDTAALTEKAAVAATLADDTTELHRVFADKNGGLYLLTGKTLRSIDAAAFYSLCEMFGPELYKLRELPTAKLGGTALPVAKSAYTYRKLDGKFYRPQFTAAAAPTVSYDGKALPIPAFSIAPKTARAAVTRDGEAAFNGTLDELKGFVPQISGSYRVEIAADFQWEAARGEVVWAYGFAFQAPLKFVVEGSDTFPGEVVVLRAYNVPDGAAVTCENDLGFVPAFVDTGRGTQVALLPVSYYTGVGTHTVKLSCGDVSETFKITEKDKKFDIQNMTVSAETADETINSRNANAEYERVISPLRSIIDNKQYWDGRFILPVTGAEVTTTPGTIRYVNGAPTSSRHNAVDLAIAQGTPVLASGAGRVICAQFLQLTGNTVLIEHGFGLKTWYYHMVSLNVKEGEMVEKGHKIGEVGTTGFSTGPHLHFGVSVNGVFTNPYTVIETDLLNWKE